MKTCHNCPHAPRIAANEFENVDFAQTPCASCPQLNEDAESRQTREFVEGQALGVVRWSPPQEEMVVDRLPITVLEEALRGFLELPPRTFRILQRRYKGDAYALIADELNISPSGVEVQLKRALEVHPHLKSLLPAKAKRHDARKRKMRSAARRGKPGAGVKMEGGAERSIRANVG